MSRGNLLPHFTQATGERRLDHQRTQTRLCLKTKIRLTQAFIPGNGDAGFPGKSPLVVAGFARFFKEGDTVAVLRMNIFRKLLRFERRPGAVGVQT